MPEPFHGFCAGAGIHEVVPQVFEDRPECEQVGGLVVHQQDVHPLVGRLFVSTCPVLHPDLMDGEGVHPADGTGSTFLPR